MKSVILEPVDRVVQIKTSENLLQALLADQVPVKMACGGRGLCATCHIFVERGTNGLTPETKKEKRTLSLLSESAGNSRLACQARILSDGVVVRLPKGLYVQKSADLDELVGRRAQSRLLHPVDGRELVPAGKIITRSTIRTLRNVESDLQTLLSRTREA